MTHRPERILVTGMLLWLVPVAILEAACISSGDGSKIQAALQNQGDVAKLCQGAVFDVWQTIEFTKPDQVIRTRGTATGDARALLRAQGGLETVIRGLGKSGVQILRLRIDGNRDGAPRSGKALIRLGGNEAIGQKIARTKAWDPRGWSVVHVPKGPGGTCSGAIVNNNELGPAGFSSTNQWADGISLGCPNSTVMGNTITDVTDGGIVIFGAPGSTIENNTIIAGSRELLGGINMVDHDQTAGNFSGVLVRNNIIDAQGAFIKIGIAMGPNVWFCDAVTKINAGATVTGNELRGAHFGYGYVVDGVEDWTATGNISNATHGGTPFSPCSGFVNSPPAAFIKHGVHVTNSSLQSQFIEGTVHGGTKVTSN